MADKLVVRIKASVNTTGLATEQIVKPEPLAHANRKLFDFVKIEM